MNEMLRFQRYEPNLRSFFTTMDMSIYYEGNAWASGDELVRPEITLIGVIS